MTQTVAIEDVAARLDETASRLQDVDPQARAILEEHLRARDEVEQSALRTIVRTLREDPRGKELLFDLVDDPVVRMVLAMHGLIRPDPVTLALSALDRVRPNLVEHGGDVELVRIEDDTAVVRLRGACQGCSMAATTLRDTVDQALLASVPGLRSVVAETAPAEPAFVPLTALRTGPPETSGHASDLDAAGWVRVADRDALSDDTLVPVWTTSSGTTILAIVAGGVVIAFANSCPHLGAPLDDGLVDAGSSTLTCAGHGYTFDLTTGESLSLPGAALELLPVQVRDGAVWLRPETP